MILARMKQAYFYFFFSFREEMREEVRQVLEEKEFDIFMKMERYDKVHSYYLWKKIQISALQEQKIYHKLSLLHDCGKDQKSFLQRCQTVLFDKNRKRDRHAEAAYEKLRKINLELAKLCLQHHENPKTEEMKLFQKLDDG